MELRVESCAGCHIYSHCVVVATAAAVALLQVNGKSNGNCARCATPNPGAGVCDRTRAGRSLLCLLAACCRLFVVKTVTCMHICSVVVVTAVDCMTMFSFAIFFTFCICTFVCGIL